MDPKGQREQNESKLLDPQNSAGRKLADKPPSCKHMLPFMKKRKKKRKDGSEDGASGSECGAMDPEVGNEGPRKLFPGLETQWGLPAWISTFWGPVTHFLAVSSLFEPEYLGLSYLPFESIELVSLVSLIHML